MEDDCGTRLLRVLLSFIIIIIGVAQAAALEPRNFTEDTDSIVTRPFKIEPPNALPESAAAEELKWQPVLDFDNDGCYNVPAIGADGRVSYGAPWKGHEARWCRDPKDLDNSNVYVRHRCNHGWCVYMYDYYFEKDNAWGQFTDHRHNDYKHDWETLAVWVRDGHAKYVAASAGVQEPADGMMTLPVEHKTYEVVPADEARWDGSHFKAVYHKNGYFFHSLRFATGVDDRIENHSGRWVRGKLVNYDGFPEGVRDILYAADFGKIHMSTRDEVFTDSIVRCKPLTKRPKKYPIKQKEFPIFYEGQIPAIKFDAALDEEPTATLNTSVY